MKLSVLLACAVALAPAADAAALALVRGPYLQNAAPAAMTLRWRTDVASDSRAWIGLPGGPTFLAASDPALTTEHELRVTGLSSATAYRYEVGSSAGRLPGADATWRFTTPPAPGAARPTRIWALGDVGTSSGGQARVRDAYLAWTGPRGTDVTLLLGDNAYERGTDADFQDGLFEPFEPFLRGNCTWAVRGNHDDLHTGPANDFYELFTFPEAGEAGGTPSSTEAWYSFDHGDVHFVALDSQESSRDPGSPMLEWLAADLAATDRRWVIAFFHHPPYSKGSHDSDDDTRMTEMRENVMPILEQHGVDVVLSGHSHAYERSFLLDGHYGESNTLTSAMILNAGDGDPAGDGAYVKPPGSPGPHGGTVAIVAGGSATLAGGDLDHPAMAVSLLALGSVVLDVDGDRLEAFYLDDEAQVRDRFTLRKSTLVDSGGPPTAPQLALAGANPARRGALDFRVTLPAAGRGRLSIVDVAGRHARVLTVDADAPGPRSVRWDGRDEAGHPVAAGAWFAVLDFGGARRTLRFVLVP